MRESAAYQQGLRQRELAVRAPDAWSQPGERSRCIVGHLAQPGGLRGAGYAKRPSCWWGAPGRGSPAVSEVQPVSGRRAARSSSGSSCVRARRGARRAGRQKARRSGGARGAALRWQAKGWRGGVAAPAALERRDRLDRADRVVPAGDLVPALAQEPLDRRVGRHGGVDGDPAPPGRRRGGPSRGAPRRWRGRRGPGGRLAVARVDDPGHDAGDAADHVHRGKWPRCARRRSSTMWPSSRPRTSSAIGSSRSLPATSTV